ncbi:MAG: translesion error-prone DNA polymerase V autoproteolytic subunit [Patescibacteria group bacterium]
MSKHSFKASSVNDVIQDNLDSYYSLKVKQVTKQSNIPITHYGVLVSAGFPSPADDFIESPLDLNDIIEHPNNTFSVRVVGDSMIGAGIYPGDLLIIDRSITPISGDVILAVIQGEFTIKRFIKKDNNKVYLVPENKNYKSILITENSEFEVWGKVICTLHDPNCSKGGFFRG